MTRGESYSVEAWLNPHPASLHYEWTFSKGIKFGGRGEEIASFVAEQAIEGVTVEVKISGLPPDCANRANAEFSIAFNPGSPLILDSYGRASRNEEKAHLSAVLDHLSKFQDRKALFVIGYKDGSTKDALRTRMRRINDYFKLKDPSILERIQFAFDSASNIESTTAYIFRNNVDTPAGAWATDIEKIIIPRTAKRPR